jgi:serine/threonine protein kinase
MAADIERLARFDREAKTLAALNHPNIAAIYGLERSNGQTALARCAGLRPCEDAPRATGEQRLLSFANDGGGYARDGARNGVVHVARTVQGQEMERTTNVWAFGCVLFEMLTGPAASGGDSATDVLAAS